MFLRLLTLNSGLVVVFPKQNDREASQEQGVGGRVLGVVKTALVKA
ncbi:hypothetical protein I8752_27745 [Nostocaceae cyanobacterium CENA369]|uniref:Uncharacterized protein n=1 Tax=Dendronalium phyllosphericum CENA369 TaxID=1725256 RepID=A0A8J7LGV3_9NOST|nr:hypothetical protein [Dendronalium phyllosphericum]MBH8576716.1 hypothetical protein [Dendronalium phyllosphericum CENA369]